MATWLCAAPLQAEVLRIGLFQSPDVDPLTAVDQAILIEAYAQVKQPIEFVELPSRRALNMLLSGELDANIHRVPELLASHPSLVRVATPLSTVGVRIYAKNSSKTPAVWSDLSKLRIAYQRGVLMIERNLPQDARRIEALDSAEVFRLLREDFADVALVVEIEDGPLDPHAASARAIRVDAVLSRSHLHHYLHERHRALSERLDAALKRLVDSNAVKTIRQRALKKFY